MVSSSDVYVPYAPESPEHPRPNAETLYACIVGVGEQLVEDFMGKWFAGEIF
jgi:hypothetical protein